MSRCLPRETYSRKARSTASRLVRTFDSRIASFTSRSSSTILVRIYTPPDVYTKSISLGSQDQPTPIPYLRALPVFSRPSGSPPAIHTVGDFRVLQFLESGRPVLTAWAIFPAGTRPHLLSSMETPSAPAPEWHFVHDWCP